MAPSLQLMVPNTSGMDETRQLVFNTLFNDCFMAFRRDPSSETNCTAIASQAMARHAQINLSDCCMPEVSPFVFLTAAFFLLYFVYISIRLEYQVKGLAEDVKKLENHAGISIKILREKESEYENARHNWDQFEASDENMERGLRYTDADSNGEEIHGTHDIEKN